MGVGLIGIRVLWLVYRDHLIYASMASVEDAFYVRTLHEILAQAPSFLDHTLLIYVGGVARSRSCLSKHGSISRDAIGRLGGSAVTSLAHLANRNLSTDTVDLSPDQPPPAITIIVRSRGFVSRSPLGYAAMQLRNQRCYKGAGVIPAFVLR